MCSAANAQLQRSCSVDKETDMLVQLNGFHTHVSDLAKKEMDKIIKDAQTAGTSLETPKNVLGRKMKKNLIHKQQNISLRP